MATTYHKTFKAPIWLSLNVAKEFADPLLARLVELGAFVQDWPAKTFFDTIVELSNKGWHHIVGQPFPYAVSIEFLQVASKAHINKVFGSNKLLGTPSRPWGQALERNIRNSDDYEKLFNQILSLEDPLTLSQLFDIGDRCHNGSQRYSLLVSSGDVPRKVLQDVAENVIVAGTSRGDVTTQDVTPEQFVERTLDLLDETLTAFNQTSRR